MSTNSSLTIPPYYPCIRYVVSLLLPLLFVLVHSGSTFGQWPGINYQAILVHDSTSAGSEKVGQAMDNQSIDLRFSLLTSQGGTIVYQETHATTTNDYGLFTATIGQGATSLNPNLSLEDLDWSQPYSLQVEVRTAQQIEYRSMGIEPLSVVPYALYAIHAPNRADDSTTSHAVMDSNDLRNLLIDSVRYDSQADELSIHQSGVRHVVSLDQAAPALLTDSTLSGSGTSDNPLSISFDVPRHQTLEIDETILSISDGNAVDLGGLYTSFPQNPALIGAALAGDSLRLDLEGEAPIMVDLSTFNTNNTPQPPQQLSIRHDTIFLEDGGYAVLPIDQVADDDADHQNELIVAMHLKGTMLEIDESGQPISVDLAPLQDGYEDDDADPVNELISNFELNDGSLEITDAGGTYAVDVSEIGGEDTDDQTLYLDGTLLSIEDGNEVDLADIFISESVAESPAAAATPHVFEEERALVVSNSVDYAFQRSVGMANLVVYAGAWINSITIQGTSADINNGHFDIKIEHPTSASFIQVPPSFQVWNTSAQNQGGPSTGLPFSLSNEGVNIEVIGMSEEEGTITYRIGSLGDWDDWSITLRW